MSFTTLSPPRRLVPILVPLPKRQHRLMLITSRRGVERKPNVVVSHKTTQNARKSGRGVTTDESNAGVVNVGCVIKIVVTSSTEIKLWQFYTMDTQPAYYIPSGAMWRARWW
jgi:hypothetical protein